MESRIISHELAHTDKYVWFDKVILVVEDIELNYRYIKELIEPSGVMLLRAVNGAVAVELCKTNYEIDLVLMDIYMPVMNGYEATRQIKALRSDLPIIAQTAYAMSEDRKLAMDAGCDDFIAKPIEKSDLLSKIDSFFKLKKN